MSEFSLTDLEVICQACGYPKGMHRMVGDNCPDVLDDGMFDNEVLGWKETTFKE